MKMADTKKEATGQDPSTEPVIALLTKILDEFSQQVQSRTPPPLSDKAKVAVAVFKEISLALDVKPSEFSIGPAPENVARG
jgi:hypothetical protein